MNEQSKAIARRKLDPRYANRWFSGRGCDVGCGRDVMTVADWPRCTEVVPFDIELGDGDAQYLTKFPDNSFDFVHSAHCLEHVRMPQTAVTNWVRVLKPAGFLIVTIPEELLYESGKFPSRWNSDHKSSFTMRGTPIIPHSINLLWLLWKSGADVEHLTLLTDGWDPVKLNTDQTLGPAECAIEFVIRKPDPNRPW